MPAHDTSTGKKRAYTSGSSAASREASRIAELTPREREVSILVAEGLTNKLIGEHLYISPTTVRHHLTSIFQKLEISSRFELIVLCYRNRMVDPPPPLEHPPRSPRADDTPE
jgi:DNA-binding NarL/FixJ family response regulator